MERKIINCPHCGMILSPDLWKEKPDRPIVKCPECGSQKNWKAAHRKTPSGIKQRYHCRDCGVRFTPK